MTEELQKNLDIVNTTLNEAEIYEHACHVLNFDEETICPAKAMEEQGEVTAFLSNKAFLLKKNKEFINAAEFIYVNRNELGEFDRVLAESLHREYQKTKNITPEMDRDFSLVFNRAFVNWLAAKKSSDFSKFAMSLKDVCNVNFKQIALREGALSVPYDNLLDIYERGITTADLDRCFAECKERLIPLFRKITASKKKIRTDFLSRAVTDEAQSKMAEYLLKTIGFDFNRGAFTTTEHPFTDGLAKNDARVTTHYYQNMFYSSMFSIIHEGGHALFEQNQPKENYEHHISGLKTLGQHESVSRFYENRIGRSKGFIQLIFKKMQEIFPSVMLGVTENELYEAMNLVEPSLIRTEADEFTYTFHIIIRYELEKEIVNGRANIDDLPKMWNDKYEEYLGIRPQNARDGILQDVHWTSGFGYFPTYALGNMYNAMYYNRMSDDFDIEKIVSEGRFDTVNAWMCEHVWSRADRLDAKSWIREITGREFTSQDFLDYIEKKYCEIYNV